MTDRELMQQALEALEEISGGYSQNLIVALRDRLAQPEQSAVPWSAALESVWGQRKPLTQDLNAPLTLNGVALYPRQQPLTNGEIYTAYITATNQTLRAQDERLALAFARAIEAAHGIKGDA